MKPRSWGALLASLALSATAGWSQIPDFSDLAPTQAVADVVPGRDASDLKPGDEIFRLNQTVFVPGTTKIHLGRALSTHPSLMDALVEALHLRADDGYGMEAIVRRQDGTFELFETDRPETRLGEYKFSGSFMLGTRSSWVESIELYSPHEKLVALTRRYDLPHHYEARPGATDDWERYETMESFYRRFDRPTTNTRFVEGYRRGDEQLKRVENLLPGRPDEAIAALANLSQVHPIQEASGEIAKALLAAGRLADIPAMMQGLPGRVKAKHRIRSDTIEALIEAGRLEDALAFRRATALGLPDAFYGEQELIAEVSWAYLEAGNIDAARAPLLLPVDEYGRPSGASRRHWSVSEKLVRHFLDARDPETAMNHATSKEAREEIVLFLYATKGVAAAEDAITKVVFQLDEAKALRRQFEIMEKARRPQATD